MLAKWTLRASRLVTSHSFAAQRTPNHSIALPQRCSSILLTHHLPSCPICMRLSSFDRPSVARDSKTSRPCSSGLGPTCNALRCPSLPCAFYSMPNMTGRPGYWTMEMNGGSSAPYLACTPCVPLFVHFLIRVEAAGLLDYQGWAGIISIVRWNLRPVIFGVDLSW